jgi:hypothetical protein
MPWQAQLDLNAGLHAAPGGKGLNLKIDVFNVLNRQTRSRATTKPAKMQRRHFARNYLQVAGRSTALGAPDAEYNF